MGSRVLFSAISLLQQDPPPPPSDSGRWWGRRAGFLSPLSPGSGSDSNDGPPLGVIGADNDEGAAPSEEESCLQCCSTSSEEQELESLACSMAESPHAELVACSISEGVGSGAELCSSGVDDDDNAPAADRRIAAGFHEPSSWTIGLDCGSWISRGGSGGTRPLLPQSRVLLANLFVNLRCLPMALARDVLDYFQPQRRPVGKIIDSLISVLCGVGLSVARGVFAQIQGHGWDPSFSATPSGDVVPGIVCGSGDVVPGIVCGSGDAGDEVVSAVECQEEHEDPEHRLMKVYVREVLGHAVRGMPDVEFMRSIARYRLAGLPVGTKYCSRQFVVAMEHLSGTAVSALTRDTLQRELPALGIPTDFALVFDGVSIGARAFSHHETLLMTGVVGTCACSGEFRARFLGAPSMGHSHSGSAIQSLLFSTLRDPPCAYEKDTLRARVAIFGGDGAVVRGGEAARHASSGAADLAWRSLHPDIELLAVDWDLFHRADVAGLRAAKNVPLALELHDVNRVMSSLFGVGSGRVLLRGVADVSGLEAHRSADVPDTRKVAYFSRVTQNLIHNFPVYHAGLQARLALTRGPRKTGSQTVQKLVDVGRRLTTVDFVTFLLLYHDIHWNRVSPFASAAEQLSLEPIEMLFKVQALLHCLEGPDKLYLHQLKSWAAIATLLVSYVPEKDLWNLWSALQYSPMGRTYPTFTRHAHKLLFRREFRGCLLLWQWDAMEVDASQVRLLSPRCQCACRRRRPRPERTTPQGHRVRVGHSVPILLRGRSINVPEWVANTLHGPNSMLENGDYFTLRFARAPRVWAVGPELQGVPLFRRMFPACEVPVYLQQVHKAVNGAMSAAFDLLGSLHGEFTAYCNGPVGTNPSMQRLLSATQICFDWATLTQERPAAGHIAAFRDVWALLQPCLRHTLWPSTSSHPHVEHQWPPEAQMCVQYMLLCGRVRDAAREDGWMHEKWFHAHAYIVKRVTHHGCLRHMLEASLHECLKCSLRRALSRCSRDAHAVEQVARPLARILDFAGALDTQGDEFKVALEEVVRVGWGRRHRRMRMRFKASLTFDEEVGHIASLSGASLKGCWVRVLRVARKVIHGGVAATLDIEPSFSNLSPSGHHCWHVARLHHRCRHLRGVEAACERWGSLLHSLWDEVAGLGPARLASRLLLRESGLLCQGSPVDEAFVGEIARVLVQVQGKTISTKRRARDDLCEGLRHLAAEGSMEDTFMNFEEEPGVRLHLQGLDEWWTARHMPCSLPEKAQQAVRDGTELDRRQTRVRSQLPLFAEDARTLRRGKCGSVLRARLKDFLTSDTGREWVLRHKALWNETEHTRRHLSDESDGAGDIVPHAGATIVDSD